jgi:hypothetical protein
MMRAWGAIILGDPVDLGYWARALTPPTDPWIEMHGEAMVLRSASLGELTASDDVRNRCVAHIERLNGAIALAFDDARPVQFGSVVEVGPNGVFHRHIAPPAGHYEIRGSSAVIATINIGPDGKPIHPHSRVPAWAEQAEQDDLLDDALIYFGRPIDWFDIYKALECLILRFGGRKKKEREKVFNSLGWADPDEITRLKRTANAARHARKRFKPPKNPMDIDEAHAFLGLLLRRAFDEAGHHPPPPLQDI